MLEEQIRDLVGRYLAHRIDRSDFAQEFAALYFQVRNERDASLAARRLCNSIVLPFGELSRGHRSESSFREELTKIAHPFVARIVSIDSYFQADPYAVSKSQDVDLGLIRKGPMMAQGGQIEERRIDYRHG